MKSSEQLGQGGSCALQAGDLVVQAVQLFEQTFGDLFAEDQFRAWSLDARQDFADDARGQAGGQQGTDAGNSRRSTDLCIETPIRRITNQLLIVVTCLERRNGKRMNPRGVVTPDDSFRWPLTPRDGNHAHSTRIQPSRIPHE